MSWKFCQLSDVIAPEKGSLVSGPFGSNIGSRFFVEEGVPVIRGNNLTKGAEKFVDQGFVFLTGEKAAEFTNCIALENDIIFTAAGSIGQVGIIPAQRAYDYYIISNKQIRARIDKTIADPLFVYLWLSSPKMLQHIEAQNNGGAVPLLNLGIIRRLPVPMPPLPTQQRIAGILSAYDELIENNWRRIRLLEQAARLLYREWFVHLRFPGHETAKIVDGLPEGWKRAPISALFDTSSGSTPSRKNDTFFGGQINWLKTQELQNCFIFETDEKITEEGLKRSSAKMFPENTVIIAMYGATIGQLAILAKPSSTNQACCALLPKRNPLDYLFGYCLMEHSTQALKDRGQGAAQNNVSQQVIRAMEVVLPREDTLDAFNTAVAANFSHRRTLQAQNAQLTRARDLLLPRLMDGRIPV